MTYMHIPDILLRACHPIPTAADAPPVATQLLTDCRPDRWPATNGRCRCSSLDPPPLPSILLKKPPQHTTQ